MGFDRMGKGGTGGITERNEATQLIYSCIFLVTVALGQVQRRSGSALVHQRMAQRQDA